MEGLVSNVGARLSIFNVDVDVQYTSYNVTVLQYTTVLQNNFGCKADTVAGVRLHFQKRFQSIELFKSPNVEQKTPLKAREIDVEELENANQRLFSSILLIVANF